MKAPAITLGEVVLYLSTEAYKREPVLQMRGRDPDKDRECRMLIMAANIVDAVRANPKLWTEIKKIVQQGQALTRETGE